MNCAILRNFDVLKVEGPHSEFFSMNLGRKFAFPFIVNLRAYAIFDYYSKLCINHNSIMYIMVLTNV